MRYGEGATIAENNALFNNCTHVHIFKDYDWAGRAYWRTLTGPSAEMSGFDAGRAATRKEALEHARERYPNLTIWAAHGVSYSMVQEGCA